MFIRGMFIPKSICLFIEPEGGQGGGGQQPPPDASADLRRRLAENEGSNAVVAQQLANENYQLRVKEGQQAQSIVQLKGEITDLKKQLPAEGAVVLSKEDAATYAAITALGKLEEIKAQLEELPALKSKVAAQEKKELLHRAADSAGFDRDVFAGIDGIPSLEYEAKTVDGKEIYHVKDGDKLTPVAEYIETHKPGLMPALKPQKINTNKHVIQDASGKAPQTNIFDGIRERKKKEREAKQAESKPLRERLNKVQSA